MDSLVFVQTRRTDTTRTCETDGVRAGGDTPAETPGDTQGDTGRTHAGIVHSYDWYFVLDRSSVSLKIEYHFLRFPCIETTNTDVPESIRNFFSGPECVRIRYLVHIVVGECGPHGNEVATIFFWKSVVVQEALQLQEIRNTSFSQPCGSDSSWHIVNVDKKCHVLIYLQSA